MQLGTVGRKSTSNAIINEVTETDISQKWIQPVQYWLSAPNSASSMLEARYGLFLACEKGAKNGVTAAPEAKTFPTPQSRSKI